MSLRPSCVWKWNLSPNSSRFSSTTFQTQGSLESVLEEGLLCRCTREIYRSTLGGGNIHTVATSKSPAMLATSSMFNLRRSVHTQARTWLVVHFPERPTPAKIDAHRARYTSQTTPHAYTAMTASTQVAPEVRLIRDVDEPTLQSGDEEDDVRLQAAEG